MKIGTKKLCRVYRLSGRSAQVVVSFSTDKFKELRSPDRDAGGGRNPEREQKHSNVLFLPVLQVRPGSEDQIDERLTFA